MTSTLGIKKIQYPNGTNIATLDSSGSIAFAGAITGTLATAAQTNITSVGTLTSFRSTGIDDNADALAMTIDTSERILIGTTNASIVGNGGIALKGADGRIDASGGGGPAALFDRRTNDGDIVGLYKAGTAVGSIGVTSGDQIYIGRSTGSQGIKLKNSALLPSSNAGADADNSKDLGTSSARWKDLYLSGGLKVGGTGTANTLDDYEEGTWTPNIIGYSGGNTQTYSYQLGNYTKVGRLVTATFQVKLTAKGNISGNYVHLTGMPFSNLPSRAGSGIIHYVWSLGTARDNLTWEMGGGNTDRAWLTFTDATTTGYVTASDIGNSTGFMGTLIYYTS